MKKTVRILLDIEVQGWYPDFESDLQQLASQRSIALLQIPAPKYIHNVEILEHERNG